MCGKRNNFELLGMISGICKGDLEAVDITGRTALRWAYESNSEMSVRVLAAHPAALGYGCTTVFSPPEVQSITAVEQKHLPNDRHSRVGNLCMTQLHVSLQLQPWKVKKETFSKKSPFASNFSIKAIRNQVVHIMR